MSKQSGRSLNEEEEIEKKGKEMLKYSIHLFSIFMMVGCLLFLTACKPGQGIASSQVTTIHTIPTPTTTPIPTRTIPTPTTTSVPVHTIPTPTTIPVPKLDWSTYTGNGVTLIYPGTWQQSNSNRFTPGATIDFQACSCNTMPYLSVTIQPANPGGSEDELLYYLTQVNMKHYSNVNQTDPNSITTFDGITWHVATSTADDNSVPLKEVDMVGQNYSSGKVYYLTLRDGASSYNQTDTTIFQPMLQSLQLS